LSLFESDDSQLTLLFANLKGTTLMTGHIEFLGKHAHNGYLKTFESAWTFDEVFVLLSTTTIFINQDVDLDNWPNVKELNCFASETVWTEGIAASIKVKLNATSS